MFAKRTNWDLTLNPLAKALAEHRAAGKPLIDLTVSNPTECGFIYDTEAILAALRNPEAMKYEPNPKGLEVARRAVAGYYADRGDVVPIEDIFLTTSTSEGYSWVMRLLCDPGDEVLVPTPSYPLFDFLADLNDVQLVRYPLFYVDSGFASTNPETRDHGWHFDFHALEQAITPRTRAVIVVHPNNPTGNYVKPHERERLNQICGGRGLALIADEVFLDFALDGVARASFVTNGRAVNEPLTFTLSGLSKICGLPQMKVAWVVVSGPEASKQEALERLEVIADTYLSVNTPLQLGVPVMLATRRGFQDQVAKRVKTNSAELDLQLSPRLEWRQLEVEGGWCAVLAGRGTSHEMQLGAGGGELRQGVMMHPGDFYGFGMGCFVVSLLAATAEFHQGLRRWLGMPESEGASFRK